MRRNWSDHHWRLSQRGRYLRAPGFRSSWRLRGAAAVLALDVTLLLTPVGILLDRLTEYPEECDAAPETVTEAVRQLRERNPNGTETNW